MLRGSRAPLIAGVGALVLVGLLVFLLVLPKMGEVSDANDALAAAQAQQGTLESQLAALEQAEAAAPEAKATIQEVEQQIPPTADEPGMLLLLKNAASRVCGDPVDDHAGHPDPRRGDRPVGDPARGDGDRDLLPTDRVPLQHRDAPEGRQGAERHPRAWGRLRCDYHDDVTNLLQLQANVVMYTSDQSAGPGSEPGPTEDCGRSLRCL